MKDLSRISVVLPSLDPDEKLIAVIDGLLEYGFSAFTPRKAAEKGKAAGEVRLANGAQPTLDALNKLRRVSPDTLDMLFDYLDEAPLYDTVSTDAGDFLLVHAGLKDFSPVIKLRQYTQHDLLWTRPTHSDRYFDHITTIFGHTPTAYYGDEHAGKVLFTDTWIDVDTGGNPALLCLDDLSVTYPQRLTQKGLP